MDSHLLEAFALAADRAKALELLIPGTEDYYFHACLVQEQKGDFKALDALLAQWNKRYGETALFQEIRNRRTLLRFDKEPAETMDYVRDHLGLSHDHEQVVEGRQTAYPTKLDQKLLARPAIKEVGYAHSNQSDLSGFTEAALEWILSDESMDGQRLRNVLSRVRRPDHAKLVELVAAELRDKQSSGFGALSIHKLMLQEQLDRLLKLLPALREHDAFVHAYLVKLQPGPDVDWQNDAKEREAFLTRVWDYVQDLAVKFNPLKAHVLYHRLDHDRRLGVYDADRFLTYVKLPRAVGYANQTWIAEFTKDVRPFNLGNDFRAITLQATISDDEELVRDYLAHFIASGKDWKVWEKWISDFLLRQVFASTKMLQGIGDMEQWYSMLNDPSFVQALKDRVEIGFARVNPTWFRAGDPVTLQVDLKNVATLSVKVFEINALNYFLAHGRDVDTSIDLDGLVASEERVEKYEEPPIRRVRRTLAFPTLTAPGAYIVELIGGGISSRALVKKGRLRFFERVGSAGHVFTVLNENREILQDASIWLGGKEYRAEADGTIHVPFSTRPMRTQILLRHGNVTTLETFDHQAESYQLLAGIYVDRESLLKKKEAQVVVRASLRLNGVPVSISLLEEATFLISSTDRDGVSSSQEVPNFALHEDRESVHTFQVPDRLASISFGLRGKVQNLSQGSKVELNDGMGVTINAIEVEATIEDLHLARTADGYVVNHLGKSGEPKPATAIAFTLSHRDITSTLEITLQTDGAGRIELGHLRDIVSLSASTPSGVTENWVLPRDRARVPAAIHVRAGESFRVPLMDVTALGAVNALDEHGKEAKPEKTVERRDASLLEFHGGTWVRDHFASLSRKDGYLEVAGLPAGDYDLLLKRDLVTVRVRVVPGDDRAGWIAGDKRLVERRNVKPLQIVSATEGKKEIEVAIGNAGPHTRVHVFGTRWMPAYATFDQIARAPMPVPKAIELFKSPSHYVSGRDIGDEYRYILERKHATKFPGNMLTRPGLLLNPWAVRTTQTATQDALKGAAYGASPAPAMAASMSPPPPPAQAALAAGAFANLDFLANPAAVLVNLKPDEKGIVRIPREAVAHANNLRIVAVDGQGTVARDVLLPEVRLAHADLRLKLALDADGHFSERKQITVLAAGQALDIADITTSKTELYGTLGRVYRLLATLSGDAHLTTFGFVQRWPELSEDDKKAKYSEFACHELSFFLSRKDPAFFAKVIKPYLRNKKDKTFMDHYLLEDDLTGYRGAWAFGRLNIVERILLAQRIADESGPVTRHASDLNDLVPRDLERLNHLFSSAIQGSALEAGDALGIAAQALSEEKTQLERVAGGFADLAKEQGILGNASAAPGAPPAAKPMPMSGARREAAPRPAPKAASMKRKRAADMDDVLLDSESEGSAASFDEYDGDSGARDKRDDQMRAQVRQLYQKLDKTQEWAENNYWHLPIEQQGPDLVTVNPFWRDYAKHRHGSSPFLSANVAWASRNFTEMMCALAVLDLPFDAPKPGVTFDGARMKLVPGASAIAWHKEIKPVVPATEKVPILVSQNYFRDDDRTRYENDEEVDKYVTGEFLVNVVYTCQVVLTNPTSTGQKLDLLLQIPTGSIPVNNGFVTDGKHLDLSSYATESIEYSFYFPAPGTFAHFPVHVAKNEQLIAFAAPMRLNVVRELSEIDKTSWAWLSQNGTDKDVLQWMETNNVDRLASPDGNGEIGLELIAWRMRDKKFYAHCIALLSKRHIWNGTLWGYSVLHRDVPNIRELLLHHDDFLDRCGLWLDCALVTIDAVERKRYQHLEYAPLVNARTQKLGARRTILNDRFAQQYAALMGSLRYLPTLDDDDRLAVTYYLFLQDRVEEALAMFDRVDPAKIATALQYDYLSVYAALYRENPAKAREVAAKHADHPVNRWKNLFRNAAAQIDEIAGAATKIVDDKDRDQRQATLASTEPDFELSVEKKAVTITAQNLTSVRVNYYRMDIELLFSRQPFVQQQSGQFSFIKPNLGLDVAVPDKKPITFDVPKELHGANFIVEVVAAGKRKSQAYYAHELSVQVVESYGQVRVALAGEARPLSKTYVKVYSRMKGSEVKFYKDGYTDLRGVFDYTSLNTNELDHVDRFSILVMNDQHGAVIREANPPKR